MRENCLKIIIFHFWNISTPTYMPVECVFVLYVCSFLFPSERVYLHICMDRFPCYTYTNYTFVKQQGASICWGGVHCCVFPRLLPCEDCHLNPTRGGSTYSSGYCIYTSLFLSAPELIGAYSLGPLACLLEGGLG